MRTAPQPPTFDEETALRRLGNRVVAGVDEAGRGPLAGPVVAGAVVIPPDLRAPWIGRLRDSKQLSASRRAELYACIRDSGVGWAAGVVSNEEVDRLGIASATREAMLRALGSLPSRPDFVLVDGLPVDLDGLPAKALVGGDGRCMSIAAASIVAKVTRDAIMLEEHARYPDYGFDSNKGYPTPAHLEQLRRLGPCPIHRRSFAPVHEAMSEDTTDSVRSAAKTGRMRLGGLGEQAARGHLERAGFTVLDINFRCPHGEIDIVARDAEAVVFVEVRTQRGRGFGTPEESITAGKARRLIATAQTYLQTRDDLPSHWRIDLVAVDVDSQGRIARIERTENAVTGGG
ncbi:MAG: ribonuclease HII [Chloroflexota bacterium]|nr:ribonuclease HII [Chloroflexota bacterium]MDE2941513.1 ribonuclease HII [Chloroflexota bacterium]MDE3267732.1 ribonuclease HII [Chloroflexota bacterium]